METTYIYAHVTPYEDEIFYIGKSDDPWGRLGQHLAGAKTKTYYQAHKLRKLSAQGIKPRVEIIAEVPVEEWEFWEKHYIKYFRDLGFRLTNATEGGSGITMTGETKEKIRKTLTGRPRPREVVEKIRNSRLARPINTRPWARNRSGTSGVSFSPARNMWEVTCSRGGKKIYHRRFLTHAEAVAARKQLESGVLPVEVPAPARYGRRGNTNTSGCVGVSYHQTQRKWKAEIRKVGQRIYLGMFSTRDEAVAARTQALTGSHESCTIN